MVTSSITRPLPPAVADRLVKIAGLLASDQPGEVVAAARQATHILREHDCTWGELLQPIVRPPQAASAARPQHRLARHYEHIDWRVDAAACLRRADLLSDWEYRFVTKLFGFPRLSSKQTAVLVQLVERVRAAGGAA
jgi:ubiquinone biosynthesis protein UbiJ